MQLKKVCIQTKSDDKAKGASLSSGGSVSDVM